MCFTFRMTIFCWVCALEVYFPCLCFPCSVFSWGRDFRIEAQLLLSSFVLTYIMLLEMYRKALWHSQDIYLFTLISLVFLHLSPVHCGLWFSLCHFWTPWGRSLWRFCTWACLTGHCTLSMWRCFSVLSWWSVWHFHQHHTLLIFLALLLCIISPTHPRSWDRISLCDPG